MCNENVNVVIYDVKKKYQDEYISIEYDGKVYSKATGSSGTVTIGVDGDRIKIEATNYKNLEVTYEGPYAEII